MHRRSFVKLLGAAAPLVTNPFLAWSKSESDPNNQVENTPVVISTWEPNTRANTAAWTVLMQEEGTALDAVHQGVMIPEADPDDTSVGYGGFPDRDGRVTLDACIMDHQANIGSVMALEHIMHPVSVARLVMEKTPHVQLVGEGALAFALAQGFKKQNLLTPRAEIAWKQWLKKAKYHPLTTMRHLQQQDAPHDTIGMLALDRHGNLSGACSTSGLAYKMHGRVGDSPIIGAGLYVDNEVGAATATGVGEEAVRICAAHSVVEAMRHGLSPAEACRQTLLRLAKYKGESYTRKIQLGLIALNKQGQTGCYSILPRFTMARRTLSGEEVVRSSFLFEYTPDE